MISYDNLWNVMKEKGISQYALIKKHHISPAQITRLKRNESVSTNTIDTFCRILECEVGVYHILRPIEHNIRHKYHPYELAQ